MNAADLPRRSRLDPRILPFVFGNVARFRPDVVHAHNYEASVWARFAGLWFPRVTVVVHVHSSRFVYRHGRHRILTDRVLFRRADAVIALDEAQKAFLLERIRLPARKLHLVPNGIDTDRFAPPAGAARRPRSAVCVASLTDVKNHAGLLRAWAAVSRTLPDAHLTLVGDGPLRASLEEQARDLGLAGRVAFTGLLDDVRPHLWAASVFVLPSHSEALPLSLLEAMAAGCAPVASAVGGIPDVVVDDSTGRLVPPRDDAALATALVAALGDAPACAATGARAHESVVRRFGLGAWLDRIEEIYRSCARRG
jgi:glycosyltransferase involved in cell wall biosynthesis